uniref:Uncharacterized protein n=1 Tax=Opuntia streptacantha TaxID=393608 RepID=A0A7C9EPG4_OPUST
MFSFERDCIRFEPLTIVLATSNANMDILFPLVVTPETKPPLRCRLVMLLPSVSKTSTALPSPAEPALPKKVLTSETFAAAACLDFVDLDLCDNALGSRGIPSSMASRFTPCGLALIPPRSTLNSGNEKGSLGHLLVSSATIRGPELLFTVAANASDSKTNPVPLLL